MSLRVPLSAPDITEAEIDAVTAVLRTNTLSLGPELAAFERDLAAFNSVEHAVAVSSGTAGLHLALLALGIGDGDEVIVPSFAFVAVANAVLQVRATPVFAEIEPMTLNLDPNSVEEVITRRTRAILVVHTFGVPAEMDTLQQIARCHGLALIEDACEAIGAEFGDEANSRRVSSFGDIAVFGFYPNKQFTTGEGGAVLTRNPEHAARIRSLRNQGRKTFHSTEAIGAAQTKRVDGKDHGACWLDHAEIGYNYRLSEMACALGRVQLSRINEILAMRRGAALRFQVLLEDIPGIALPSIKLPKRSISWFVYVVRLSDAWAGLRDRVQAGLTVRGIASGRYFAPIHLQPAWRSHPSARRISLPITEAISKRTLALPFFNRITMDQQQVVADALREVLANES